MPCREVDRLARKQLDSTAARNGDFNSVGVDRRPALQCYQCCFGLIWHFGTKFFCDLVAALDQLVLPKASVRFGVRDIEQRWRIAKKLANPVDHQSFQIAGRYAPVICAALFCSSYKRGRGIVPVLRALLDRVSGCQTLTGRVKHKPSEEAWVLWARAGCPLDTVLGEQRLDLVP